MFQHFWKVQEHNQDEAHDGRIHATAKDQVLNDGKGPFEDKSPIHQHSSEDVNDPLNWSWRKKHTTLFIIVIVAFLADFGSSIGAVSLLPQALSVFIFLSITLAVTIPCCKLAADHPPEYGTFPKQRFSTTSWATSSLSERVASSPSRYRAISADCLCWCSSSP